MTSRSFFTWLLVGNMILFTVILSLGSVFTFRSVERQIQREAESFNRELLETQREYIQRLWESTASASPDARNLRIQAFCAVFNDRYNRCRLTVIDAGGHVLGDSEENPRHMALHNTPDRPEVMAALEGRFGKDARVSATKGVPYRYSALPITHEKNIVGVVRLAIPVSDVKDVQSTLLRGILLSSLLTLVIAMGLSAIFAWLWLRPLRRLYKAALDISRGKLETPITFQGPLELERLATALERMRRLVSAQVRTIERQHESLHTILNDLDEAIFAIDHEDRVLYVNPPAEKMLGIKTPEQKTHLWAVMRYGTILSLYEQMKNTGRAASGRMELEVGRRRLTLEVQAAPISPRSQPTEVASLLIVRDQTDIVRMNQMKAEFVANASHELRTPLAAIRAAIDNLRDGVADDPETVARLMDVLDRHVGRLEMMVHDLLDLHMMENESIQNRISPVSGEEIAQWVTELFETKAEAKNIRLELSHEMPDFPTDAKRLHLILQNIVDNAIKFSPPGGTVSLTISVEGNAPRVLKITCQDNGCGIPAEEQSKIFNRFYQSDSSKTGDTRVRGIGLGMAIVKHATERLDGKIDLVSKPGAGTTITIRIPEK